MSGNRLLILDLPAVLDLETVSPIARMRGSHEKRFLERFERAASREQKSGGVLSDFFRFVADRFEKVKEPELLKGAGTFVKKITMLESYAGERVWLHAAGPPSTEVRGQEYRHTYFSPYFAAFRDTTSTAEHFMHATLSNYGLDERMSKTAEEIDNHLKTASIRDDVRREDVMIVTADAARAANARNLGYQVVHIKDGNYDEAFRRVQAFFPLPRAPEAGHRLDIT